MEMADENGCSFIKKIIVDSNGKAVIIPDFRSLINPPYSSTPLEGCFCPRTSEELKKCLKGCTDKVLYGKVPEIKSVSVLDENGKEISL